MAAGITIRDLATAAGVSIATVSRALTGKGRVSDETAERVRELAAEIGYEVDPVGRALREGGARSVGMVVPALSNPFYSALVRAVEDELATVDFELVIVDSHDDAEREAKKLRLLRGHRVQGIILVAADGIRSADAARAAAQQTPLVCVDRRIAGVDVDFVGVDNAVGMTLVLDHLTANGVRTVALASSDNVTSVGQERHRAFASHARELGLDIAPPVIDAFDIATGLLAGRQFGHRDELPDAIVAGDDLIALGLISSLSQQGIHVPRDVFVTGFDGTYLAALVEPGITSVEQPIAEIAAVAVERLLRPVSDGSARSARSTVIAPTLRVRGSTSADRGHRAGYRPR